MKSHTRTIRKYMEIDSAHKLNLPYDSKCNNLHGHRWGIWVEIETANLTKYGMVVDFGKIKEMVDEYDHCYLNERGVDNPTAENLAELFALKISTLVQGLKRIKVTVAETTNNVAEFEIK
jgi:6-pyruvoyltetrahydropterin/6-carboxytetrahydropterin synthase